MTKAGIIAFAKDVKLMDAFNVLSGLLDIENLSPENEALKENYLNIVYKGFIELEKENSGKRSKAFLLKAIAEKDQELAESLMNARYLQVLYEYNKLTNKN